MFSPLPLLVLALRRGPILALAAACLNSFVITLVAGEVNGLVYLSVFAAPAVVFSIVCFRGMRSLNVAGGLGVAVGAALALVVIWAQGHAHGLGGVEWVRSEVYSVLDQIRAANPKFFDEAMITEGLTWDAFRAEVIWEIPGLVLATMVFLLAMNVLLVGRLVPGVFGFPESRNLSFWKVPEAWLWPTLLAGLLIVLPDSMVSRLNFDTPLAGGVAQTILFVSVVLYGLQGLTIVGTLLTRWKIRGLFRSVLLVVLVMTPMVVGVLGAGFLDTWFDFRRKFGHT